MLCKRCRTDMTLKENDVMFYYDCPKCRWIERVNYKTGAIVNGKPIVTCPYCSSTNCKKISGASKVGKVLMWGVLAAGTVGHTWHCYSCGSNFG